MLDQFREEYLRPLWNLWKPVLSQQHVHQRRVLQQPREHLADLYRRRRELSQQSRGRHVHRERLPFRPRLLRRRRGLLLRQRCQSDMHRHQDDLYEQWRPVHVRSLWRRKPALLRFRYWRKRRAHLRGHDPDLSVFGRCESDLHMCGHGRLWKSGGTLLQRDLQLWPHMPSQTRRRDFHLPIGSIRSSAVRRLATHRTDATAVDDGANETAGM